jgi:hypothetical protein
VPISAEKPDSDRVVPMRGPWPGARNRACSGGVRRGSFSGTAALREQDDRA